MAPDGPPVRVTQTLPATAVFSSPSGATLVDFGQNLVGWVRLFNFQSQFSTQYNLLFADILLITIPPLLLYLFLNRRIVEGMTAGAVEG